MGNRFEIREKSATRSTRSPSLSEMSETAHYRPLRRIWRALSIARVWPPCDTTGQIAWKAKWPP